VTRVGRHADEVSARIRADMRIAMISAPRTMHSSGRTAGLQRMIGDLCAALANAGHEVVRFQHHERGGARNSTQRVSNVRREAATSDPYLELAHASAACRGIRHDPKPFDIVHTHIPAALPFARFVDAPIVCSVHHGWIHGMDDYYAEYRPSALVMASRAQEQVFGALANVSVIPPGLDPALYPLSPGDGGYVVYLGAAPRGRAPADVVDAACGAGARLLFADNDTLIDDDSEGDAQLANGRASWPEPKSERIDLLGFARAVIVPAGAGEPTVITALEAMLCGTPLIVAPGIGATDLVADGRNGFVATDFDSLVRALRAVPSLSRADVRTSAAEQFGHVRMAAAHEALYARAIEAYRSAGERPSVISTHAQRQAG
jgi:glycosyltransferase involved in cell wall biosynthesis